MAKLIKLVHEKCLPFFVLHFWQLSHFILAPMLRPSLCPCLSKCFHPAWMICLDFLRSVKRAFQNISFVSGLEVWRVCKPPPKVSTGNRKQYCLTIFSNNKKCFLPLMREFFISLFALQANCSMGVGLHFSFVRITCMCV